MAIMATDLDIERESSFVTGQPVVTFPLEKAELSQEFEEPQFRITPELPLGEEVGKILFLSALLHDLAHIRYAFHAAEEIETQVAEIWIGYGKSYGLTDIIRPWVKVEKERKEIEQEAFLAIVSEFSQIEKVQSIYVQKYREEVQIQTLLSIVQYDNDLMDTLLDIEYDIRKRYPEIVFEFFYPPIGISEKEDFIHPQAYCIYSR